MVIKGNLIKHNLYCIKPAKSLRWFNQIIAMLHLSIRILQCCDSYSFHLTSQCFFYPIQNGFWGWFIKAKYCAFCVDEAFMFCWWFHLAAPMDVLTNLRIGTEHRKLDLEHHQRRSHNVYPDNDNLRWYVAISTTNHLKLQKWDARSKYFQLFILSSE